MKSENKIDGKHWTLLTQHGRVLLLIAKDPEIRVKDLALIAGITERSALAIISDLEAAKYVIKKKIGRRNSYKVNSKKPFRHPAESNHKIEELIKMFI